jgi:hypothetical protein
MPFRRPLAAAGGYLGRSLPQFGDEALHSTAAVFEVVRSIHLRREHRHRG